MRTTIRMTARGSAEDRRRKKAIIVIVNEV